MLADATVERQDRKLKRLSQKPIVCIRTEGAVAKELE